MSAGRVVGRYVVHSEIAAGGMATVHVGRLMGPVGFARTVAIKRLHPHFAKDPEFVAMFLDEARLAARVRHANVVSVLDVVAEGGELFLVMDYVEGESLARLVGASRRRGNPPPARVAAAVVAQALHGLHAAHEAKDERGQRLDVVHRDVSPQNVLVGTDGVARVLDFGVAKAVGRASVTREGELKGKLPYMAPEQIRRRGVVDRRTDVYAAGVVLWEALAAQRLFDGDGEAQIMSAVLEGATQPPSAMDRSVPRALDAIAMRALALDPARRFASAEEMARAIEDAVGIVPPSEIGAWVRALASDSIAQRASVVAMVESSPGLAAASDSLSDDTETLPFAPAVMADSPQEETATVPIALPPAPVAEPAAMTRAPNKRARWLALPIALLAMLLLFFAFRRPAAEAPHDSSAADSNGSVVTTKSAEPIESATQAMTATTTAPPPVTAVTTVQIDPPAPSATHHKAPRPTKPVSALCNPPYFYEGGIKKFKPQCVN